MIETKLLVKSQIKSHAKSIPESAAARFARWGLYPLLGLWVVVCLVYAGLYPDAFQAVQAVKAGVIVLVCFYFEWSVPYQPRWGMSWRYLLKRDLVFVVINGAGFATLSTLIAMLAVYIAGLTEGPISGQPVWLQVVVALLVFEALQYVTHRLMHESRGPITHFLWRSHAIHHLPQQLYIVMHAVFHPINAVIVRLFVQLLPLWLLGYDPYPVLIYTAIIGLHGTISHFNVDMRMGWMNYVFVGPELHRYHHSANTHEAANYGVTLSVYDLLFNTFLYKPGIAPDALGLREEDGYPAQIAPVDSILFPFSRGPVSAKTSPQDDTA